MVKAPAPFRYFIRSTTKKISRAWSFTKQIQTYFRTDWVYFTKFSTGKTGRLSSPPLQGSASRTVHDSVVFVKYEVKILVKVKMVVNGTRNMNRKPVEIVIRLTVDELILVNRKNTIHRTEWKGGVNHYRKTTIPDLYLGNYLHER